MNRGEISRAVLWGVIALIVLVLVGLWGMDEDWVVGSFKQGNRDLTSCGQEMVLFSVWPVDKDKVAAIVPLGNMEPEKGAVFPRDRLLWLTQDGQGTVGINQSVRVRVKAPSDGWLTKVEEIEYWAGNKIMDKDYSVSFSPCQEVEAKLSHIQALETSLDEQAQSHWGDQSSYQEDELTIRVREAKVGLEWPRGGAIGWAGGTERTQAFDWGMTDDRREPLIFAHTGGVDNQLSYTVCPLDYYPGAVRKEMQALLGDGKKKREAMPTCGQIDQDKVGTVQGLWRAEKTEQNKTEEQHVALVHDEIEPLRPVFSIGTSLEKSGLMAGLYYFNQKEDGVVNWDFGAVTERNQVYCYQGLHDKQGQAAKRILLVEIIDDKTIKMEARPGFSCASTDYNFSDRMTVFER